MIFLLTVVISRSKLIFFIFKPTRLLLNQPNAPITQSKYWVISLDFPQHNGSVYGAMTWWLRRWTPNPGVLCSKPASGSKVDSAFDTSEVDQMGTRNFLELSGKK